MAEPFFKFKKTKYIIVEFIAAIISKNKLNFNSLFNYH